jgi:nucleotide-binding universal stress UspA family protein
MKTIIIPTDFSPAATCSMNYALDMAVTIGASVILFHVYNVPVSAGDVPVLVVSTDSIHKDAETKLASLKEKVEHITSGTVKVYTESRMGDVIDELETLCKNVKPFAVVMGSRGTTGLERIVFGSTTLAATRHLTSPVIAVPIGTEYGNGIRKIGFACDFRDIVETIPAAEILQFVKTFGAELHILNVDDSQKHQKPDAEQSLLLQTLLGELNPIYHFIEHDDVEEGVSAFAETNNLDLVMVIPKKHKVLQGLFKSSSTKQLVTHTHIPLMCIHES